MTKQNELRVKIVGTHFRQPGKAIAAGLPAGQHLRLAPEPENPYDSKAIKVVVVPGEVEERFHEGIQNALSGTGYYWHELHADGSPIHIGYVPDSDGKLCADGSPGNREVGKWLERVGDPERVYGTLCFDAAGKPEMALGDDK